jgi:predicted permease
MTGFFQDLRYTLRQLRESPGFTATAVLTLALGIGANTLIFSIVNQVLLRPLPYDKPQQLVKIWGRFSNENLPQNWISEPEWWDMGDRLQSYSGLAAYSAGDGANFSTQASEPVRIATSESTASIWPLLGISPLMGRTYTPDDDRPGHDHVAVLSYAFWSKRLASDPNILGKTIQLDAEAYTVIGVLPEGFNFAGPSDLWLPLGLERAKGRDRGSHYLEVIGRLRDGVSTTQASAELNNFSAELIRTYPQNYGENKGFGMMLIPLHTELVGDRRTALLVLFGAVALVLLIACANLANLLLARASIRAREIAIRAALGAGRVRIIRQLLTESVLISLLGGLAGVAFSVLTVHFLHSVTSVDLPNLTSVAVDTRVLLFAAVVSILTGVVFGLAPAMHASSGTVHDSLKDAGRSSAGVGGTKLRNALVVSEISMAMVLLAGAGLLIHSLRRLVETDPGFGAQHVLTACVTISEAKYPDGEPLAAFFRNLVDKERRLHGVQTASAVSLIPFTPRHSSGSTYVEHTRVQGLPISGWAHLPYIEADRRFVVGDYFEAMRIPLLQGRFFNDSDNENAPLVAIVDEDFARRFWPGQDPLGQHIALGFAPKSDPPQALWRTVIGVVGHVHNDALDQVGREQTYYPQSQVSYVRSMYLVVRTAGDPSAQIHSMQMQLASLDPTIPLYEPKTMDDWLEWTVAQRRFNMLLLGAFGMLALGLAAVGTYGVLSYSVNQRNREIGIRMALGASREQMIAMVIGGGIKLAAAGLAVGLIAALLLTRLMASLLYQVSTTDPPAFGAASVILAVVAIAACYMPARRAMKVDPIVALRCE